MLLNFLKRIRLAAYALGFATIFSSCSEFQTVLKSQDYSLWYRKGLQYYEQGEYGKSAHLLGGILTKYAGTAQYDTIMVTYAHALAEVGDYYTAAHYFSDYVKTYPSSSRCEDCQFMAGYCYYKLSPKPELDQADTESAIEELQLFVNLFPESPKVPEAEQMMSQMTDKLAYKDYLSAKLYFNLGNYMGNNYNSAVITAQNCLRKYPDTEHREELSFLILKAKYIQADRSVLAKQADRYRDAIDEYFSFVNEFPDSKFRSDADDIYRHSEKGLSKAEREIPPSQDDLDYYRNFGNRLDQERAAQADLAED